MSTHIYVGPTISYKDVHERLPGAVLHPPVAHGDLLQLRPRRGDTVLIIDGDFYERLPVRNQEILWLLQEGVCVVGAAGMGALRAAELHTYGMVGIGTVFEMYRAGTVDGDDEVAVGHGGPDEEHQPRSESLINIRVGLRSAVDAGELSIEESARVSALAESLPVADRSWPVLGARSASDPEGEELSARLRDLARKLGDGVQREDALKALDFVAGDRPDGRACAAEPPERVPVTPFLKAWLDQNRVRSVGGKPVDDVSVLRFLQLYDPVFAERWALYAMGVIADGVPTAHPIPVAARRELADRCVARAAERLGGVRLDRSVERYWLAEPELFLDEREKLLRVLVRSYRAPGGAPLHGCPRLLTQPADLWAKASHAVTACWRENQRVAELSPRYSVQRLKRERVLSHFARIWRVADAPDVVLAAARDRAITSLGQLHTYGREMMLPFLDRDADDVERAFVTP